MTKYKRGAWKAKGKANEKAQRYEMRSLGKREGKHMPGHQVYDQQAETRAGVQHGRVDVKRKSSGERKKLLKCKCVQENNIGLGNHSSLVLIPNSEASSK